METGIYALCENEQKVFAYLSSAAPRAVEICVIASDCFPEIPPVQANSRVRNSLRKLRDRLGLARKVGRGTYEIVLAPTPPEVKPAAAPSLSPPTGPAPAPVAISARLYAEDVSSVRMLDCTLYGDCLSVADKNDWSGFGCAECQAFQAHDQFQRESDVTSLRALDMASENFERTGCAGRKRGVKPGTRRKLKAILPLVELTRAEEPTEPPQL